MARTLIAVPFLALALSFAMPVNATVIVPLSIEDMAVQSACVVRGRVVESHAAWDNDHQRIYTYTTVDVVDAIHAPAGMQKQIIVRTIGGEVGKIGMRVAGVEKFAPSEEVLIFLRKDPVDQSMFQTVGMSQGKFSIEHEAKGRMVAVPDVEGLAFARPDANGTLKVAGDAPQANRIPLTELRDRVLAAISAKPADPVQQIPNVPQQPTTPVTQQR